MFYLMKLGKKHSKPAPNEAAEKAPTAPISGCTAGSFKEVISCPLGAGDEYADV